MKTLERPYEHSPGDWAVRCSGGTVRGTSCRNRAWWCKDPTFILDERGDWYCNKHRHWSI